MAAVRVPTVSMQSRRRLLDALLAVAVLLTVAAAAAAVWVSRRQVDVAVPTAQPNLVAESAAPRPSGSYVRTRIDAAGRLTSDQFIVTDQPVQTLTVRVRHLRGYGDVHPVVSDLRVAADGRSLESEPAQLSGAKVFDLGGPTTVIHLRYVTDGGVIRSAPSSSGRSLVIANPLLARVETAVPRDVVLLDAPDVLGLSCVEDGQLPSPCGRPDPSVGWRVVLEPVDAGSVVLGQVDLPAA